MSYLNFTHLSKRFGSVTAIGDLELSVQEGELLVVLGHTGAGKTTLLRCIAGLERPDEGTIELRGEDITRHDPASRDIAVVFQNFSLYPRWSVYDNLAFPLRSPRFRLPEDHIHPRVETVARQLHIERFLDRPAERLSGGEMQRVAIGRALVRRPRLFLFDEPLSNLDAKLREELRAEIFTLQRKLGTTMIYVTHDQDEALALGDRIAVLEAGWLHQVAPPLHIYDNPENVQVARTLGSPPINLVPVRFFENQLDWELADRRSQPPGLRLTSGAYDEGQRYSLAVRPEDVVRVPSNGHPAEVLSASRNGPDTTIHVRVGKQELHLTEVGVSPCQPGDSIELAFRRGRIHVFDETGRRLSENFRA